MKRIVRATGACLAMTVLSAGRSWADAPPPDQPLPFDRTPTSIKDTPVLDRARPYYDPPGIAYGDFLIFAQAGLSETYNDNLFATHSGQVADERTTLTPDLLFKSRWARNLLQLDLHGDIERYFDRPDEAVNDGGVSLTGRYDGQDFPTFSGTGEFNHATEPRSSTLSPRDVVKPIQFDQAHVQAKLAKDIQRLKLSLTTDLYQTTFQNGRTPQGAVVPETIYDTQEAYLDGSAAYVITPDLAVVAHVIGNDRHFLNTYIPTGSLVPLNRDSSGVEATMGVNLSLTHLIRAEALVGYLDQSYQDSRVYRPVTGPSTHVKVVYLPTGLTTVSFTIDRKVNDAQDPVASSFLSTASQLQVDHELYRNIILSGSVKYEQDKYSGISRQDTIWDGQASVSYLLDRHFSLKLLFDDFTVQSRGVAGIPGYDVRQLTLALVARY